MPGDKRDIWDVLKFELEFLEKGGMEGRRARPGSRSSSSRIRPHA